MSTFSLHICRSPRKYCSPAFQQYRKMSFKFNRSILGRTLKIRYLLELFVIITVALSAFLVTFQVIYNASLKWLWIVIYSCDAIYLASIVSRFFTEYQDKRGEKVTDWAETAAKYGRTYFIVDIISILPLEIIGILVEEPDMKLFVMAFLRLNRYIRTYRVWYFLSK